MSRLRLFAICMVLVLIALTVRLCQQASGPPKPPARLDLGRIRYPHPELGIRVGSYPMVDGSTSTQPLQMIMACKLLGVSSVWIHDERDDTRKLWPEADDRLFEKPGDEYAQQLLLCEYIRDLVRAHGTSEAYINLINHYADLILVARSPSDDELTLARKRGVELDARPLALDAFVFLLNAKNPVSNLSIEQLRSIYSGRTVNWRDVGGPDEPIRPYQRPRNSGSQELMQKLVMRGQEMVKAPDLLTGSLMSSTFLALDKDVHGIGYSVYYYHEFMSSHKDVKACAIEGTLPTSENIRSRRYPFISEVFVVTRRDLPQEHPARLLRDWMLAHPGQSIVEESGYVAIGEPPKPEVSNVPGR